MLLSFRNGQRLIPCMRHAFLSVVRHMPFSCATTFRGMCMHSLSSSKEMTAGVGSAEAGGPAAAAARGLAVRGFPAPVLLIPRQSSFVTGTKWPTCAPAPASPAAFAPPALALATGPRVPGASHDIERDARDVSATKRAAASARVVRAERSAAGAEATTCTVSWSDGRL